MSLAAVMLSWRGLAPDNPLTCCWQHAQHVYAMAAAGVQFCTACVCNGIAAARLLAMLCSMTHPYPCAALHRYNAPCWIVNTMVSPARRCSKTSFSAQCLSGEDRELHLVSQGDASPRLA
jgi:hypothetical protein